MRGGDMFFLNDFGQDLF